MTDNKKIPESSGARSTVSGGVGQAEQKEAETYNKNFEADQTPAHDDSALESLGKAITAPMRDAADEGSTEEPGSKP